MAMMYPSKLKKPTKGVKRAGNSRAWKKKVKSPGIRPKRYGVLFNTNK